MRPAALRDRLVRVAYRDRLGDRDGGSRLAIVAAGAPGRGRAITRPLRGRTLALGAPLASSASLALRLRSTPLRPAQTPPPQRSPLLRTPAMPPSPIRCRPPRDRAACIRPATDPHRASRNPVALGSGRRRLRVGQPIALVSGAAAVPRRASLLATRVGERRHGLAGMREMPVPDRFRGRRARSLSRRGGDTGDREGVLAGKRSRGDRCGGGVWAGRSGVLRRRSASDAEDASGAPSANVRPRRGRVMARPRPGAPAATIASREPPSRSRRTIAIRDFKTRQRQAAYRRLRTVTKASAAFMPIWEPRQTARARIASTERASGAGRI